MTSEIAAIRDVETLAEIYGAPAQRSISKVATKMTPHYRTWIDNARFLMLCTVGPEGTDASPRGDNGPVVRIVNEQTLLLPDWKGNNRIDTLRNIVRDDRVSLTFMVPGCNNVVRVNGTAIVTKDADILASFERKGIKPRTVIVVTIGEMYFQCAKALMRSDLWGDTPKADVPSAGAFLKEFDDGFDAVAYDEGYVDYAIPRYW